MMDRIKRMKVKRGDEGFTLIELLVVITILGILAAIVVFSVGGISDKGQTSACATDKTTLQTAEEAYYAKNTTYTDGATLTSKGFLSGPWNPQYNNIAVTGSGASATYQITPISPPC